jgi:DNA repair protein RecO (recombination protein O)
MLLKTKGIILRSTKYGETSLIISVFTELAGLHSYMIKGIRNDKAKSKRAGLLHPGSIIELVVEHKPNRQLQHIKEFQPNYYYQALHSEVIKNSIAIFSLELLHKLLPKEEAMIELFQFSEFYLKSLDQLPISKVGNFPLHFIITCGRAFGYNLLGVYSLENPYLNAQEGTFTKHPPTNNTLLHENDASFLSQIININQFDDLTNISIPSSTRARLLDWYIEFLQLHTQHLSALKSLEILKVILH